MNFVLKIMLANLSAILLMTSGFLLANDLLILPMIMNIIAIILIADNRDV